MDTKQPLEKEAGVGINQKRGEATRPGSHLRAGMPPGDVWQCLEALLVVTLGRGWLECTARTQWVEASPPQQSYLAPNVCRLRSRHPAPERLR